MAEQHMSVGQSEKLTVGMLIRIQMNSGTIGTFHILYWICKNIIINTSSCCGRLMAQWHHGDKYDLSDITTLYSDPITALTFVIFWCVVFSGKKWLRLRLDRQPNSDLFSTIWSIDQSHQIISHPTLEGWDGRVAYWLERWTSNRNGCEFKPPSWQGTNLSFCQWTGS
jgi:hypothetical protein